METLTKFFGAQEKQKRDHMPRGFLVIHPPLSSGGDTAIISGGNLALFGSSVTAAGNLSALAGGDIYLLSAEQVQALKSSTTTGEQEEVGFGTQSLKTNIDSLKIRQIGSSLSGLNVDVQSGNNLVIQASSPVGWG
jgi:hypothetical protein